LLAYRSSDMAPQFVEQFLQVNIKAALQGRKGRVNLVFVLVEKGLDMLHVQVRRSLGLGKGEIE